MSGSLAKQLAQHLDSLIVGPPTFDDLGDLPNVVVYPLFPTSLTPDPPEMITLSEGLRRGVRLSDTGLVNKVHVDNPLPTTILAGESELLMGTTQMRSMQFSCLVPPHRRASLPVNCVEEGQPTDYQAEFNRSDSSPWSLRSFKMEQMAHHGEPVQFGVWDKVRSYLETASSPSNTQSIHAVYERFSPELSNLSYLFPRTPGQIGAICAVGSNLYGEFFSDPELLEDRYDQFLRSALVEAVVYPGNEVVTQDKVEDFLTRIVEVSVNSRVVQSRSLQSSGRTLVFTGGGIAGSALVDDGRLIHLCAHQKCLGQSSPFASQLDDLEKERASWQAGNTSFLANLQQDYADRRKMYNAFKARLTPGANPQIQNGTLEPYQDLDTDKAAPRARKPMPLNSFLHNFFLNLFRRS
jgi:hypothetical protein